MGTAPLRPPLASVRLDQYQPDQPTPPPGAATYLRGLLAERPEVFVDAIGEQRATLGLDGGRFADALPARSRETLLDAFGEASALFEAPFVERRPRFRALYAAAAGVLATDHLGTRAPWPFWFWRLPAGMLLYCAAYAAYGDRGILNNKATAEELDLRLNQLSTFQQRADLDFIYYPWVWSRSQFARRVTIDMIGDFRRVFIDEESGRPAGKSVYLERGFIGFDGPFHPSASGLLPVERIRR